MDFIKTIISKIAAGYRRVADKINSLIGGDGPESPGTKTAKNPNRTVLVGGWRIKIHDGDGKCVYEKQLIFDRKNEAEPGTLMPKIIGRYDEDYYERLEISFDPDYDISINRIWKGSETVHRIHAWLEYHKDTKELVIKKYPREPEVDNGMYDEKGNPIEEKVISDGDIIFLGPSITLRFSNPGIFVNAAKEQNGTITENGRKKVRDMDAEKRENPVRMPGNIPGRGI